MFPTITGDPSGLKSNVFNYDNPIAEADINGNNFRITDGHVRDKHKTYLLYKNGDIVSEHNSVHDAKMAAK